MIYVHRDWSGVPQDVIEELKRLADELDAIEDSEARKKFIRDNAKAWAALRDYMSGMSKEKCWYSEARESVSRYHIDHFRPYGRAKQAEAETTEGYSWLAFDVDNFRLAGVLCNTINKEHTDESIGKGDWFPLLDPTKRATLANRDLSGETPILLDPTDPDDPTKLVFNEGGTAAPDPELANEVRERIVTSIRHLGLDQSLLNGVRNKVWRACRRNIDRYSRFAKKPKGQRTPEEEKTMREIGAELMAMTKAESEFSAVARCCLTANKLGAFIVRNELLPVAEIAI